MQGPITSNEARAGGVQVSPLPPISKALNQLAVELDCLDDALATLRTRLDAVLVPPKPCDPAAEGADTAPETSSVTATLWTAVHRLSRMVESVNDVITRLEV